jgi:hypothetical protein
MGYNAKTRRFNDGEGVTEQRDLSSMMPSTVPRSPFEGKPGPRTITPKNSVSIRRELQRGRHVD